MARMVSLNPVDDQSLGSQVGLGYQIEFALVANLKRAAESLGQQSSRIAGGLNSEVKQTIPFHFRRS